MSRRSRFTPILLAFLLLFCAFLPSDVDLSPFELPCFLLSSQRQMRNEERKKASGLVSSHHHHPLYLSPLSLSIRHLSVFLSDSWQPVGYSRRASPSAYICQLTWENTHLNVNDSCTLQLCVSKWCSSLFSLSLVFFWIHMQDIITFPVTHKRLWSPKHARNTFTKSL